MASCARSSAAVGSPHSVRAKARRCGISATKLALERFVARLGSGVLRPAGRRHQPFSGASFVRPAKDLEELVRHGLVDHLVEHLTKLHADGLLAQPRLVRGAPGFFDFWPIIPPRARNSAPHAARNRCVDTLSRRRDELRRTIREHGDDPDEIKNWVWPTGEAVAL